VSEIRKWLESIGLGQYADAFEANDIDMDLLKQVDDQMLKDIGVASAGHRLRIRNAIAKVAAAPVAEVNLSASTPHETALGSAERRQLTVMFCDLVVPHRRTADPRCMKLCYSVCALSAQRSVFSLVREARFLVGPRDLEHP